MVEPKITGLMVYYYMVCKRKLWFSNKNISLEWEYDSVIISKSRNERWLDKDIMGIGLDDTQFI